MKTWLDKALDKAWLVWLDKAWLISGIIGIMSIGIYAYAQQSMTANQGSPGKQGDWPIKLNSVGSVTLPIGVATCITSDNEVTTIGTTDAVCDTAVLTGRDWTLVCNSASNTTHLLRVQCDGDTSANYAASLGVTLGADSCVICPTGTTRPRCVGDTASTRVEIFECNDR